MAKDDLILFYSQFIRLAIKSLLPYSRLFYIGNFTLSLIIQRGLTLQSESRHLPGFLLQIYP